MYSKKRKELRFDSEKMNTQIKKKYIYLTYMLFAVISSAVIFPVSVFCDNLTDTDSSGIVQLFADIYIKWFWVPLIVIAIIWGFSQNDQAKEKYKKSMIVLIVVYVIASKWSTFKATIELISSKFGEAAIILPSLHVQEAGITSIVFSSPLQHIPFLFS